MNHGEDLVIPETASSKGEVGVKPNRTWAMRGSSSSACVNEDGTDVVKLEDFDAAFIETLVSVEGRKANKIPNYIPTEVDRDTVEDMRDTVEMELDTA